MREILLITALGALGWYTYSLDKKVNVLEKEKAEASAVQIPDESLVEDLAKSRVRIQDLEVSLKEASQAGLDFKKELDSVRSELDKSEDLVLALRGKITDITVSRNSAPVPSSQRYVYQRSERDSKVEAQIQTLLKNRTDAIELLSQASQRSGYYAKPATLKSNFAASSVDRKKYEDYLSSEKQRLSDYVRTVESKLLSLGYKL